MKIGCLTPNGARKRNIDDVINPETSVAVRPRVAQSNFDLSIIPDDVRFKIMGNLDIKNFVVMSRVSKSWHFYLSKLAPLPRKIQNEMNRGGDVSNMFRKIELEKKPNPGMVRFVSRMGRIKVDFWRYHPERMCLLQNLAMQPSVKCLELIFQGDSWNASTVLENLNRSLEAGNKECEIELRLRDFKQMPLAQYQALLPMLPKLKHLKITEISVCTKQWLFASSQMQDLRKIEVDLNAQDQTDGVTKGDLTEHFNNFIQKRDKLKEESLPKFPLLSINNWSAATGNIEEFFKNFKLLNVKNIQLQTLGFDMDFSSGLCLWSDKGLESLEVTIYITGQALGQLGMIIEDSKDLRKLVVKRKLNHGDSAASISDLQAALKANSELEHLELDFPLCLDEKYGFFKAVAKSVLRFKKLKYVKFDCPVEFPSSQLMKKSPGLIIEGINYYDQDRRNLDSYIERLFAQ